MERQQREQLFDDRPYIVRRFICANVVELRPVPVENPGHDTGFDCEVVALTPKEELPPEAA